MARLPRLSAETAPCGSRSLRTGRLLALRRLTSVSQSIALPTMQIFTTALALASAVQAHYTFPGLIHNGVTEADWAYVRKTTNYNSHGPVQNVQDSQIRCYELEPGTNGAKTKSVKAGDTVGFRVDGGVQHPGPLQFYMAKAPNGQTAETFNGDGAVWFKIFEDRPTFGTASPVWPNAGLQSVSVKLPTCLAEGYYLLRVEHIALRKIFLHFTPVSDMIAWGL
jgi:hypothetical protein